MKFGRLLLSGILLLLAGCSGLPNQPGTADKGGKPQLTLVVINDIYRLDNLPYVRTLRAELEKKEGEVLLLHAGDFLFPSLLSQRFNGEQMVDVLNYLDGDGKAFDERMFITFGNHEFEKDKLKHADMLQSRIRESQFAWLGTNVEFQPVSPGRRMVQADNLLPSRILTVNGIRVGLLSATTAVKGAAYIQRFMPPLDSRAYHQSGIAPAGGASRHCPDAPNRWQKTKPCWKRWGMKPLT